MDRGLVRHEVRKESGGGAPLSYLDTSAMLAYYLPRAAQRRRAAARAQDSHPGHQRSRGGEFASGSRPVEIRSLDSDTVSPKNE